MDATEAIVTTQRDHGNRTERKNARMKYTVQTMGIAGKPGGLMALMSSHPPIEDRIRALQQSQLS